MKKKINVSKVELTSFQVKEISRKVICHGSRRRRVGLKWILQKRILHSAKRKLRRKSWRKVKVTPAAPSLSVQGSSSAINTWILRKVDQSDDQNSEKQYASRRVHCEGATKWAPHISQKNDLLTLIGMTLRKKKKKIRFERLQIFFHSVPIRMTSRVSWSVLLFLTILLYVIRSD